MTPETVRTWAKSNPKLATKIGKSLYKGNTDAEKILSGVPADKIKTASDILAWAKKYPSLARRTAISIYKEGLR